MKKAIGLIVNPVAGMGGSVGLKGTDGRTMYRKALALGAEPVTPHRTQDLLAHIKHKDDITLLVAPGKMGEQHVKGLNVPFAVVGEIDRETSGEDTKRIASQMIERGIELLIFVGGDGTARDVYDAIGSSVPVVAVPAGVKVFSSAFALSARAAAEVVDAFVDGTDVTEEEVLAIIRTMDKAFSLAGARVGYAIAGQAFLEALSSFYALLPQPSLCAAIEALKYPNFMRENVRRIVEERERLRLALDELGVCVHPSSTNFLLLRAEVPDVAARLRDVGVLVSDVSNQLPSGFIRVSIGTPEENEAFVARYMEIRRAYDLVAEKVGP